MCLCTRGGGGIPAGLASGIPACLAAGLQGGGIPPRQQTVAGHPTGMQLMPTKEVWGKVIFLHLSFCSQGGGQVHPRTGRYGQQAGSMHPTILRAFVNTRLLDKHIKISVRVDFGNHSSTKTCQIFGTIYSMIFNPKIKLWKTGK